VGSIRKLELKKPPSIGESLDWARALVLLNADRLGPNTMRATLPTLIKYPADRERVLKELASVLPHQQEET
jgi:hypothetical protein